MKKKMKEEINQQNMGEEEKEHIFAVAVECINGIRLINPN